MSVIGLRVSNLANGILWLAMAAAAIFRTDVVSVIIAILGLCASAVNFANANTNRQRIAVMKHTIALQDAHLERIRQHRGHP